MSAMKNLSIEQEEAMIEEGMEDYYKEKYPEPVDEDHEVVAEKMNPFTHTFWELEETLDTAWANRTEEYRSTMMYAYKKGYNDGLKEACRLVHEHRKNKK